MRKLSTALIACALGCVVHGPATQASTETVLYSFLNDETGALPYAGLLNVNGTLYGTTAYRSADSDQPNGSVFSLDLKTGAFSVLHDFGGGTDGLASYAGVIGVKGRLYGTTLEGGTGTCSHDYTGCGTVFSLNPMKEGSETVLYSFTGGTDGQNPYAGLIDVKGTLYGMTELGGSSGDGTVFSVDRKTGAETVVYSFAGGTDGEFPYAGLIDFKETLYGTTELGGTSGSGTVFSLDPKSGAETVLYSFAGGTDGERPVAGLINVKGTLYGTTLEGGAYGAGTVFSVNAKTGAETVLYSFAGGTDGDAPCAGLINVKGTLYGTTEIGGTYDYGTAFSVNAKTGAETVLYSFGATSTDGQNPYAGLINVEGTLYGTTSLGGVNGDGTIFSVAP